jgi:capsular polysaccharide transport system permease protein
MKASQSFLPLGPKEAAARYAYRRSWQRWGEAVNAQLRVIAALVRRESRVRFGEMRLGYLWAIIEPILHLAIYAVLFTYVLRRHAPLGDNLIIFMLTGLVTYFLFSKLSAYVAHAIDGNRSLLNLPPVTIFDVVVARAVLEAVTHLVVAFLLLVGLFLDGANAVPNDLTQVFAATLCTVGLGFGIGLINAVLRAFVKNWMTIFGLLLSPAFLLSGIWFLPGQIPQPFREYLLYNPLMHCIMWIRMGFYSNYNPVDLDQPYVIASCLVSIAVGLASMRIARRKLLEPA